MGTKPGAGCPIPAGCPILARLIAQGWDSTNPSRLGFAWTVANKKSRTPFLTAEG